MKLWASVRVALQAIGANTMRSALTVLGIVIGVASVIAMVAVGRGATQRIQEQIRSIGSNVLIVLSGSSTAGGLRAGAGTLLTLTEEDAAAIQAESPAVELAVPTMRGTAQVIFGNQNWSTIIQGATPGYLEARDWRLASGEPFTPQDQAAATKVALLGQTVARNLFGDTDPVGQVIRIKKVPFTVLGVLAPKGQSPWGQDQDDLVVIPLSTAKRRVLGVSQANARAVGAILVRARESKLQQAAEEQVSALLRQRHRLQPGQENDFTLRNITEVFAAQEESARVMAVLLGAIASVSLLVGGIGIMNIMLVSVTERTREIGLRMAVGARGRDILLQFLIEAVTLALLGGIVGTAVGLTGSALLAHFGDWAVSVDASALLLAFLFSAGVGIFFGFYPAKRAAELDPIEALRYE
ncbi:MAG: ABC transporter permease [candidate division NC10 bacterium]|nr:ABC transporter permease [candidate division NC10 bacterium]